MTFEKEASDLTTSLLDLAQALRLLATTLRSLVPSPVTDELVAAVERRSRAVEERHG